jgi:hypothetical protein
MVATVDPLTKSPDWGVMMISCLMRHCRGQQRSAWTGMPVPANWSNFTRQPNLFYVIANPTCEQAKCRSIGETALQRRRDIHVRLDARMQRGLSGSCWAPSRQAIWSRSRYDYAGAKRISERSPRRAICCKLAIPPLAPAWRRTIPADAGVLPRKLRSVELLILDQATPDRLLDLNL